MGLKESSEVYFQGWNACLDYLLEKSEDKVPQIEEYPTTGLWIEAMTKKIIEQRARISALKRELQSKQYK